MDRQVGLPIEVETMSSMEAVEYMAKAEGTDVSGRFLISEFSEATERQTPMSRSLEDSPEKSATIYYGCFRLVPNGCTLDVGGSHAGYRVVPYIAVPLQRRAQPCWLPSRENDGLLVDDARSPNHNETAISGDFRKPLQVVNLDI